MLTIHASVRTCLVWLDRYLGRGSYGWLRQWLDPSREYSQLTYARVVDGALRKGMRWLDAGCGHEIFKINIGNEGELVGRAGLAVGCDLNDSSLKKHPWIANLLVCNLEHLPFREGSFDIVTLNYVVEHLHEPSKVFAELVRVLDMDGLLIFTTPNAASYAVQLMRIGRRVLPEFFALAFIRYCEHRERQDVFPAFYRANTRPRLLELARAAKMEIAAFYSLRGRPLSYFLAPTSALELLFTRLLVRLGWKDLAASDFIVVWRRPRSSAPSTRAVDRPMAKN